MCIKKFMHCWTKDMLEISQGSVSVPTPDFLREEEMVLNLSKGWNCKNFVHCTHHCTYKGHFSKWLIKNIINNNL